MGIFETFILALKNIASNKVRTFLTMLGIIIGVCAVIVIIGLGNGMTTYVQDSFSSLGTNNLTVSISGRGSSRSISVDEMYAIVDENPEYLSLISPTVSMSGSLKVGSETYSATSVSGVSEDYLEMKGYTLREGRNLQYLDMVDRKNVCVVGSYVADTYFDGDAVGETLKVGAHKFTIVGVLAQQAEEAEEGGSDDCILVPYATAARFSFTGTVSSYSVIVTDEDQLDRAQEVIENALYEVFGDSNSYTVGSMTEMLDTMTSMINIVIAVLAVIAGISLVVGGIGIMNIMLVSVTERTREIGIRKALGAKEGVILRQFVMEAATTSALGGVLGIAIGYGLCSVASVVVESMLGEALTVAPSVSAVLIAFGVSAGIGVLFGFLPARKAARLNPIDALRYE